MIPSPYDNFRNSEPLRVELADLLSNPTMVMALSAIRERSRPRNLPDPMPGSHPDTTVAHRFYQLLGINEALDMLHQLTEKPAPQDNQDELESQPYFHGLPEPMKNAIREQMKRNQA